MSETKQYHWGSENTVMQLRQLRDQSLESRQRRHKPPKLPSRKELQEILDGLCAVLFPNRLGRPDLTEEGIDYFVGYTLDCVLHQLFRQIRRELQFISRNEELNDVTHQQAIDITRLFNSELPSVRALVDTDIQAAYEGDPAARTPDEVLVCYPGIMAVIYHRLAHILYRHGAPLVARMIAELAHSATGIDIHPGAQIGKSFFIDHGTGVVIGETAIIGQRVRLYQTVTLGAKRFQKDDNGMLIKGNLRHPIVEDDVVIYAGATILGRVTIGNGSIIGGNVWLTHSVPPNSVITQASERSE
jgi:serine O-acetyltransferase